MSLKSKKAISLDLGEELSRVEMKSIVGGTVQTVCTGGTYSIGCQPGYCAGAGHGTFVSCSDGGGNPPGGGGPTNPPSGNYTQCTGGTYAIGCSPGYCAGAGHGSFVGCY